MSDDLPPPPIGFRADFLECQTGNNARPYPSGIQLSYPMASPVSPTNCMPMPYSPLLLSPPSFQGEVKHVPPPTNNIGFGWFPYSVPNPFPASAITAGVDSDGTPIYVARAFHEGDMLPAKALPDKQAAYISHNGLEIPKYEFEVLCSGTFVWEFATNGSVPEGAVEIGYTSSGEKLYMARCMYQGSQTPGKLQCSHGCLYIGYDGAEVSITEYEVLVLR